MRVFDFQRDKFVELMLHIANESADDPTFGEVKLNKILFYADFGAYAELGQPITGARYQRLQYGPVAGPFWSIQAELIRYGQARLDAVDYRGKRQIRLTPERDADLSLFSTHERELVDRAIRMYRDLDATSLSDLSHVLSKGWQIVEHGEDIPYESVFLSTEDPPAAAVELGRKLASQYGWKSL